MARTVVTDMPRGLRRALPAIGSLLLFLIALQVLRIELRSLHWNEVRFDVATLPRTRLLLAIILTLGNYAALSGYDLIAFAYTGRALPRVRIIVTSLLAYAISNSIGLAMLSGASVRHRFYTRWGVTTSELSRIVFAYCATFWLGLFALGGLSLAMTPDAGLAAHSIRELARPVGWALMCTPLAYVAATAVRQQPLWLWRLELPVPRPLIALSQLGLSSVEWALAGAVLYVLLPPGAPSFVTFLAIFLVAILLGMASHIPGGLGVFETIIVLLLKPYLPSTQVVPALVVYRIVYYLCPFILALSVILVDELHQHRDSARRVGTLIGGATLHVTPRLLAFVTFLGGVMLLFSGATPAAQDRLALVGRIFPLGVIEASHFIGSIAGAALLVLSHGLSRRLAGAYYATGAAIVIGITASLLKGFDYEEATLLALVLIGLWQARPAFSRHAAFRDARLSPAWIAAALGALAASIWLGLFAYEHVQYANDLWWQFELQGDAPRFLRASVGAAVVVALFGLSRLVGPARYRIASPSARDWGDVEQAVAAQTFTSPNLVFLGDKGVLFDDDRRAFVMYGVHGRSWVALGDPVGPDACGTAAAREFLQRCDDFGGVPVFYEVPARHVHRYIDLGLTLIKLGECAHVQLSTFNLDGSRSSQHRQVLRRLARDEVTFRVMQPHEAALRFGELRAVSDEWLATKAAAEKGFSLGCFDEAYLSRFPIAVLERQGRIEAFANLWPGSQHIEISVDLMRYRRDAPRDVMQGLFLHLLQWARADGYHRFVLGMAPLSGFQTSPVAPFWNRMGRLLYEHGEAVYNFQGLRAYKQKFDPVWEAHYLAYPCGTRLTVILADVAALISGGYRRIFLR